MSKVKQFVKGNKMLVLVLLSYLVVFIVKQPTGITAIKNSGYYFKEMLIIMPVIMLLTALLEAWVPKEAIEKHMGKGSGVKGSIFAFLLGSFSAGPIYAAFPVSIALMKKGASVTNIVILLSTWAVVKIPMLANEAKFLGPQFMIMRWILTSISIFIMGYVTSKFVKREDIMGLHETKGEESKGLTVNENYCIGCSLCAKVAPDAFAMKDGKAVVIDGYVIDEKVLNAAKRCPAKAITGLEEKESAIN